MTVAKSCWNCAQVRPLEAFQKIERGIGRADCCRECVERLVASFREQRGLPSIPPTPSRRPSNRPQLRQCRGCGETVPTANFWYYYLGAGHRQRSNYCQSCTRLRAIERPCRDCGAIRRTTEFETDREGPPSPYCGACRVKRTREKHCPRCDTAKPLAAFNMSHGRPSGWCKACTVLRQREARAAARDKTG